MKSQIIIIVALNLLFCCVQCDDDKEKRTLSMEINPNCTQHIGSQCDGFTFVHIKAEGSENTLHYIWDFTGLPSLFIAKTDKNATLGIDWDNFMGANPGSINFSSTPDFVFSSVISNIYLFDDAGDKADVSDESVKNVTSINPYLFSWTRDNITANEDQIVLVMSSNGETNHTFGNGSFAMKLSAFGSSKHGDDLPHLYHSSHSMQIDLIAKDINYKNYSSPRVAVEFLIVTSENKSEGSFNVKKRRNLDDEFTPGIFDVYDIVSPRSDKDSRGAFFQYRPVCYTTKERTVSGSTELNQGKIFNFNNNQDEIEKFKFTLPYFYYGYSLRSRIAQRTNITFGVPADGFYSRSNYTSFSLLMGIGSPPVEGLSLFVVTFAIIGLGVPLLVLLVGGSYLAVKRYRN